MVNSGRSRLRHECKAEGAEMLEPWIFVALLLGVGMLLPGVAIAANWLLSPKKPNAIKQST